MDKKICIYSMEEGQRTCCRDVIELLSYNIPREEGHSFTLCKVAQREVKGYGNWVYMLFIKDDEYPVIISEEYAKIILAEPDKGKALAYNAWMNRYR